MSKYGEWKTATIASGGTTSTAIDLGGEAFECIQLILPTLTSCTLAIYVATGANETYVPLGISQATATTTGSCALILRLFGFSHMKIVSSASQGAERSLFLRGVIFG